VLSSRRSFLGTAATVLLLPEAAVAGRRRSAFRGANFSTGVLSGDPTPDGITLLTRLFDVDGAGSVRLEVATDRAFRRVVARRSIATSDARGHSVKARLRGLRPREEYFYRFTAGGEDSPVGRFRTAPAPDSREPIRFAFFSCANYAHGFFNAYERMAREDLDFVVNLGDYLYAEDYHSRADGTGVRDDTIGTLREVSGPGGGTDGEASGARALREALTLRDYRAKYELWRSDPALRRMHAAFPMVAIWDDHEVQNNYAGGAGPTGGLPPEERYALARRAAGYRAWFENMPLFPVTRGTTRIHRALRFGRHLDLVMIDERQYRADQPCGDLDAAPDCAERRDGRAFLGAAQKRFLKDRLRASRATWKVIGNEVPMMPIKVGPQRYLTQDPWHGYLGDREELVAHIRDRGIRDVVFVTGDIHSFVAGDVRPGEAADPGQTVATEFIGGGITATSPGEIGFDLGDGQRLPGNDAAPATPEAVYAALNALNPWTHPAADVDHHGYAVASVDGDSFDVRFRRMATIKRRTTRALPDLAWSVDRGRPSIAGQSGRP
jgi:alkaline phosphatase D